MTVSDVRANFATVLDRVQKGEKITVTKGAKAKEICVIVPFDTKGMERPKKRKLGGLEHWKVDIDSWQELTNEDFFGCSGEYFDAEDVSAE